MSNVQATQILLQTRYTFSMPMIRIELKPPTLSSISHRSMSHSWKSWTVQFFYRSASKKNCPNSIFQYPAFLLCFKYREVNIMYPNSRVLESLKRFTFLYYSRRKKRRSPNLVFPEKLELFIFLLSEHQKRYTKLEVTLKDFNVLLLHTNEVVRQWYPFLDSHQLNRSVITILIYEKLNFNLIVKINKSEKRHDA